MLKGSTNSARCGLSAASAVLCVAGVAGPAWAPPEVARDVQPAKLSGERGAELVESAEAVALSRRLPLVYRLRTESAYTSTSVACDVPDVFSEALRGTLALEPVPTGPNSDPTRPPGPIARYRVVDVNLLLDAPLEAERITGTGVYEIYPSVGMLTVLGERLSLELRFGDNPPVVLDSGVVPADGNAVSFDLDVDELNLTGALPCTLKSLRISAERVPANELIGYGMGDAAFYSFQISPRGPVIAFPLDGRFLMTRLPPDGPSVTPVPTMVEWGVVQVDWAWYDTRYASPLPARTVVSGSGIYQQRRGPATNAGGWEQRLVAELTQTPPYPTFAPPMPQGFDSGWEAGPAPQNTPPFVSIQIEDTDPAYPIETFGVVAGAIRPSP